MNLGKYLVFVLMMLLVGCLSPVANNTSATYVINTLPSHLPTQGRQVGTLLILPPETRPVYNTTQMAYTDKPYEVAYFGRNEWAETPSQMFLPLMMQTLQKSHHYHAVVVPPYPGQYNYVLSTQILKLQQNFLMNSAVVEFSVDAQLTRTSTNQVIATKQFNVTVPIGAKTPYAGVVAANRAAAMVLAELTNFCLEHSH